MIPIPTNESISQMTLVQMSRYIIDLLTDYLPYAERVETAATGAEAAKTTAENSATAAENAKTTAENSATAAENAKTAAANSATAAAAEYAKIEPAVNEALGQIEFAKSTGVSSVEHAAETGVSQIQSAVTTVLNTEV